MRVVAFVPVIVLWLFAGSAAVRCSEVNAETGQRLQITHFMSIEPQVACEKVITPGYVAQWLGWIGCDHQRLRIQYAYGIGVEPLTSSGADRWKKRETVAGTVLETVLHAEDTGLVLTATYGRWWFRSHVRTEAEAEEVLGILRTLRESSE